MEVLCIDEIIRACDGKAYNIDSRLSITGISTDSRKIGIGELFIPLKGERFDGHDYINEVLDKGAAVVLTEKDLELKEKPYIIVENTLTALQSIASYYKSKFGVKVVAVTGSSGKTTTKDMVAAVLGRKYNVLKTQGNLNNAIGLPLTLLNLNSEHQIAVLEMGMNSLGEIERLADIARPQMGIISNVGTAHIENLKSRENILKAKTEIFTYFKEGCVAVINGDNDMLKTFEEDRFRIIRYGIEKHNSLRATNVVDNAEEGVQFDITVKGSSYTLRVPVPGIHNVYNALSAAAVGLELGMDMDEIRLGLLDFRPSKLRMEIFETKMGIKVVNDVYNANPDSMCAAISSLLGFRSQGRIAAVLGDMLELGEMTSDLHKTVGKHINNTGIDLLVTVGSLSKDIALGALDEGYKGMIYCYESNSDAINSLPNILMPKDTVLVKGSRGMKMEEIVEFLRERG